MRCYFAGEIQQLRLHFIVTSTMLCVISELVLITWPKNFVVRKLHDAFCYIPISNIVGSPRNLRDSIFNLNTFATIQQFSLTCDAKQYFLNALKSIPQLRSELRRDPKGDFLEGVTGAFGRFLGNSNQVHTAFVHAIEVLKAKCNVSTSHVVWRIHNAKHDGNFAHLQHSY